MIPTSWRTTPHKVWTLSRPRWSDAGRRSVRTFITDDRNRDRQPKVLAKRVVRKALLSFHLRREGVIYYVRLEQETDHKEEDVQLNSGNANSTRVTHNVTNTRTRPCKAVRGRRVRPATRHFQNAHAGAGVVYCGARPGNLDLFGGAGYQARRRALPPLTCGVIVKYGEDVLTRYQPGVITVGPSEQWPRSERPAAHKARRRLVEWIALRDVTHAG
ncbi:hypothetical protein EVAR_28055_1 [Eumeta japonica]|uniref:Uncharacterized protein n=1 Tax=Eumeta variegata TaxID=151549 RepID=A0A4C1W4M0_EUMVA|nr:hypothetical protein EVAR_28055_1 [Eumeta japonica]